MRYQVPQFIDVEDKIFGPLTLKQFLYIAGGSAIAFILWSLLPSFISLPAGILTVVFFVALAFYKYNGKPLIFLVENAFQYFFSSKLYLWKKTPKQIKKNPRESIHKQVEVPKMSSSRLKDLTWGLDVQEKLSENSEKNLQ